MKTSKRTSLLMILVVALVIPTIQSCKKYPEGPAISFRSREARVANTWKVENYKVNGVDYTSLLAGHVETFSKEGSYSFSSSGIDGTGKWVFENDDAHVRITGTSNTSSKTLFILKLKERDFWYYYMDGNDRHELHMTER